MENYRTTSKSVMHRTLITSCIFFTHEVSYFSNSDKIRDSTIFLRGSQFKKDEARALVRQVFMTDADREPDYSDGILCIKLYLEARSSSFRE